MDYFIIGLLIFCVLLLFVLILRKPSYSKSTDNLENLIKISHDTSIKIQERILAIQKERLEDIERRILDISKTTEFRLSQLRDILDQKLTFMQRENNLALEKMRNTVDEKLHESLENRLNKSFEIISSRLEAVYKGLGEMQLLAESVGDLKKTFSNVRLRGTWGETQLDSLLSQMLSSEQYDKNVLINKNSDERVDFVIILPGKGDKVFLPIDSKFPLEEYQRLLNFYEKNDLVSLEKAQKAFENRIKDEADKIYTKYVLPPLTTDFAIMYFPLEGLYAEALRRDELVAYLQKKRIMICGPTNLGALLTSLQTGFKTLSIEKRSSELWQLLAVFKHEFTKFNDLLIKTQKKIHEASESIDFATKKTKTIERKLKSVDEFTDTNLFSDNFENPPSLED